MISDTFQHEITSAPVVLSGRDFKGFALYPHLCESVTTAGYRRRIRSPFAEQLYTTLFTGDDSAIEQVIATYIAGIGRFFGDVSFDGILMTPPPVERFDYQRSLRLVSGISAQSGIHSLHHAVRQSSPQSNAASRFSFASPAAAALFEKKHLLVIADFYRTGRSLHALCSFLTESGKAASIAVLAGTVVQSGTS